MLLYLEISFIMIVIC